ncbi:MAG TPA: transketolase C-terminal domain-containing protein, partial [Pseudomonadales bacterium]
GPFLVFSDYARNALRMAALMKQRVAFVFTHDSIGLGEDGPTHQAVEHAASLRLIPGMDVWRPADTAETLIAWAAAIERSDGPTSLLLSRQSVPFTARGVDAAAIRRGAYVISEAPAGIGRTRAVLIATGSEVGLAIEAQRALAAQSIAVRVVSMPSTTVFDRQGAKYKTEILPVGVPRVAIEAGVTDFWWKYVRAEGAVIGVDRFGESAPAPEVFKHFGFTVDNVVATVRAVCDQMSDQSNAGKGRK